MEIVNFFSSKNKGIEFFFLALVKTVRRSFKLGNRFNENENENEHSELVKANKNRNRNMVTNIDG